MKKTLLTTTACALMLTAFSAAHAQLGNQLDPVVKTVKKAPAASGAGKAGASDYLNPGDKAGASDYLNQGDTKNVTGAGKSAIGPKPEDPLGKAGMQDLHHGAVDGGKVSMQDLHRSATDAGK